MSQKMPIFPKKALKMPGWQHWTQVPFSSTSFVFVFFSRSSCKRMTHAQKVQSETIDGNNGGTLYYNPQINLDDQSTFYAFIAAFFLVILFFLHLEKKF